MHDIKTTFVPPLISPKEAAAMTTFSMPTLRAMANDGHFPKPRQLSDRRIAYVRAEVEAWIAAKVAA